MLTAVIISKNEALNIRRCLESLRFVDEVVVLDSGSTDNTRVIAAEYTDKVFSNEEWLGYGIQKQRALSKATGDWVLNLDADESVTEALREEIQEAIHSDRADAYRIPIQMYFYNQALKHSSSPKRHIRLFRRAQAAYSKDIVHEKILLPAGSQIGQLRHALRHDSFRDVHHALNKINQYSSYSAKIKRESGKKPPGMPWIIASTFWMFCRCYLLQRGFLDGTMGFLFSVFQAQGTFYRGVKQRYPDGCG